MMNTTISNDDNITAIRLRNNRKRMRKEQTWSTANAKWNLIEDIVDDDENDVGATSHFVGIPGGSTYNSLNAGASTIRNNDLRTSLVQNCLVRSSSRASLIQNGLVRSSGSKESLLKNSNLRARGVTMIKEGSNLEYTEKISNSRLTSLDFSSLKLSNSKPKLSGLKISDSKLNAKLSSGPLPISSGTKRISSTTKYSYKLRDMLQSDLMIGTTSSKTTSSAKKGLTRSISSSQHRRKMRKTNSLHDEFSKDIQILLQSLHSNEFVGTIHPQYHAQYVSDVSL